ncbi:MAG: hypothetical protein O2877_00625, partial [bacterium]|nr:hypothetical protein [bacterium]
MRKRGRKSLSKFEKTEIIISYLLRASIVFAIIWGIIHAQWTLSFASLVTLLTSFLPNALEHTFKIALPIEFELIIIAFIYATLFLGEIGDFYQAFWWWDN